MKLLVVEDDPMIRASLREMVEVWGYACDDTGDGQAAWDMVRACPYDLLLLDLNLPGLDGLSLCRDIRAAHGTPILLLTARGETSDRISGLEAGADDYLPKPFEPKELLLRINAVLRRMPKPERETEVPQILHLGPIRYDLDRGELWQGAQPVRLTATEAALMRIFTGGPNKAFSRAELVTLLNRDKIGGEQVQERAVDVQITRLRRKIEPDPKQPRYLQTVRGAGYMLSPD